MTVIAAVGSAVKSVMLKEPGGNSVARGSTAEVRATVEAVIAQIRERGDEAVREYSQKFDKYAPESFLLSQEQLEEIMARVPEQVIEDIEFVQEQVRLMARKHSSPVPTPRPQCLISFRLALFGPFAIGDMAGLDVYESSFRTLEKAYGERFAAPDALSAAVTEGNLGLKSGRGFLDVDPQHRAALLAYRDAAYGRLSQLRAEFGEAPGL